MKEFLKNGRALVAAKMMDYVAEINNAHIYDDGVILQLAIGDDRHLDIRQGFLDMKLPFEEARIGKWSAFVFDFDTEGGIEKNVRVGQLAALAEHYADHKWDDAWTIETAITMFEHLLAEKNRESRTA